jgi:hypothetical protein
MNADFMDAFFGGPLGTPAASPKTSSEQRTARQHCDRDGHRYQVHGKTNPTALKCSRCKVSWAIGARTEPAEAAS